MTTLKDVAALAKVSIATVSHVINETRCVAPATRARVERAVSQLGYNLNPAGRLLALHKVSNQISDSETKFLLFLLLPIPQRAE